MKKFYFDTFNNLKSFDIIKGEEVIDLYLKNHKLLEKEGYEKRGGPNEEPLFKEKHNIEENGFWSGHPPAYFSVNDVSQYTINGKQANHFSKEAFAKADVISMDMSGLNETWTHFIYLEIPSKLLVKYQDKVHSNPNIDIFKQFALETISKNLNIREILELADYYDSKYPEAHKIKDFFENREEIAWRADLDITQLISIKDKGLIYPILYNQSHGIFGRGTHRAIIHALLGFDVPIFLRKPNLGTDQNSWKVTMADMFCVPDVNFRIDLSKKSLEFFSGNEKLIIDD